MSELSGVVSPHVSKKTKIWNFCSSWYSKVTGEDVSDEKLIEKTLSGEVEAFGELVEKYQDRLYNTMFRIVGNPDDTQDVVQEAFLQAYANLSRFRMSSQFYTWIYRIAYNIAVACLHQRRRQVSADDLAADFSESIADKSETPVEETSRQEDAALLWNAIEKLPTDYRAPLVLREMEGASYEEISELLGIPVGTVRSRLHRARIALRDAILRMRNDF